MDLDRDSTSLLAQIGYLGISRGAPALSAVVFEALHALRPGEDAGTIGLALTHMSKGDPASAARLLEQSAQSEASLAFRVLAHVAIGERAMAAEIFEDLKSMDAPAHLITMAAGALSPEAAETEAS